MRSHPVTTQCRSISALASLTIILSLSVPSAVAASAQYYQPISSATTADKTSTTTSQSLAKKANSEVSVYFLNGIFNTDTQAQTSAIALFNRLKDDAYFLQLVKDKRINLRTLYNPMDPFIEDLNELSAQASIQKSALKATERRLSLESAENQYDAADLSLLRQAIFNEELYNAHRAYEAQQYSKIDFIHNAGNRVIAQYRQLANEVKQSLLAGDKVVIVAHSQGNYVAQGIFSELAQDPQVSDKLVNDLRIVGVANVAATTPNGQYLSNADDQAVYTWHTLQGGKPMSANFKAIFANGEPLSGVWESATQRQNDSQNHGFIETYLSARFDDPAKFVPHQPEIIEKSSTAERPDSIYQRIVSNVTSNIKRMLA